MKPLHLAAALAAALLLLGLGSRADTRVQEAKVAPVSVFVVRHAEALEAMAAGGDPALSPEGEERAQALAHLLAKAGVDHLYSSPFERTRTTLAPLAEALELDVEEYPAAEVQPLAETLRGLPPGSVAVVAGHSNTVPALVEALGGEVTGLVEHPRYGRTLDHAHHQRLFLVTLPAVEGAAAKMIELTYGS
jgi:phosphohistidine phosphatase SixA